MNSTIHDDEPPLEFAETVGRLLSGTCPFCGYWNHPDSNVRDAGDDIVYCSNCGKVWDES